MAQAPQPLQSKAVKRSEYLAQALKSMQETPQQIGGYGGLAARLGAQLLTKRQFDKSEKAVDQENAAALARRREAVSQFTNPLAATMMGQTPAAPTADAADEAMFRASGGGYQGEQAIPGAQTTPQPAPVPQPQQSQVPPALAQRVRMLAEQGPDGLTQAEALMSNFYTQQAAIASLPTALQADPLQAWAAATNPEKAAESYSYRARPQVVGEGARQVVGGVEGGETYNPRSFVAGGDIYQTQAAGGIQDVGNVNPSYSDITGRMNVERPQAVTTATGADTRLVGPTGEVVGQFAGRTPTPDAATLQRQAEQKQKAASAIDSNLSKAQRSREAVARAREQVGFFSAGTLTSGLPFNQSRANLEASVDTIKANLSFAELADMRANSPTGGALGGIAVRELDLLGSTIASLDTNQSQDQIIRSLDIIDSSLKRYEDALEAAKKQGIAGQQPQAGGGVSREAALAELRRRGLVQ